jgi:hypothetical protein
MNNELTLEEIEDAIARRAIIRDGKKTFAQCEDTGTIVPCICYHKHLFDTDGYKLEGRWELCPPYTVKQLMIILCMCAITAYLLFIFIN